MDLNLVYEVYLCFPFLLNFRDATIRFQKPF